MTPLIRPIIYDAEKRIAKIVADFFTRQLKKQAGKIYSGGEVLNKIFSRLKGAS